MLTSLSLKNSLQKTPHSSSTPHSTTPKLEFRIVKLGLDSLSLFLLRQLALSLFLSRNLSIVEHLEIVDLGVTVLTDLERKEDMEYELE